VTLTPSGDDYDLSVAVADGSETKVTGAGINTVTGSGTTASPYVITGTEVDGSITNEVNTAFGVVGSDLTITDGNGTLSVPLATIGSDNQVLSTSGAAGNITIEDGNTLNLNVNDADADPANEYNTTFAVNGANLELTDLGSTLSVPLTSLGTDDQALSLAGNTLTLEDGGTVNLATYLDNTDTQDLSIDATGKIISLVDGGSLTIDADDADADPTNELAALNLAAN
ncbi:hypothetical protein OO010_15995, partial [Flavobacteriaceae bacterium KMM 6898]|nr:hypothetical protein [Flavobacteriaceae bacterium KMM 6898]